MPLSSLFGCLADIENDIVVAYEAIAHMVIGASAKLVEQTNTPVKKRTLTGGRETLRYAPPAPKKKKTAVTS